MNVIHPKGVLHSFSIKNIFYDQIDVRLFLFSYNILPIISFCSLELKSSKILEIHVNV